MSFKEESDRYADCMMRKEPALLKDLRETTTRELRHDDMLSGPVVGAFLNMLVRMSGAKTVLEIGTFTGYATLWMAMALPPDGKVITCENNEKYAHIARRFFDRYRLEWPETGDGRRRALEKVAEADKFNEPFQRPGTPAGIQLLLGPALQAGLPEVIDFVFLDADKENYPEYYEKILPHLAPGAIMVVDNAFWNGEVWRPELQRVQRGNVAGGSPSNRKAAAIDRLNRLIADDPNVENVMLSVRDGLHLIRKI